MNASDELQPLLAALLAIPSEGRRAALVTLTQTRGPTFRPVGTRMLVREDGTTVCELSGGCPQHDIIAHAMDVIAGGPVRRVRYDEQSGLDVLMEMGCGGELDVLIEPLDASSDLAYVTAMARCQERREEGCLATVFACDDTIRPTRHAVWCGAECLHQDIADTALMAALQTRVEARPARPACEVVDTAQGRHEVLVEPIPPPPALVVIGTSTTARALLPLAGQLGWPATLVDFDAERLRDAPVPEGVRRLCAQPSGFVDAIAPDRATAVVVMTHNLDKDAGYLAALGELPLAYLGLLGARGRVRRVLALAGVPASGIHAPVGLDIGAESPSEIALAIMAEILAATRGKPGGPLRARQGPAP